MLKGDRPPTLTVWGTEGVTESTGKGGYDGLVRAMAEFFHTGRPPVDPEETEFMTAAQLSNDRDGAEVRLEELRN